MSKVKLAAVSMVSIADKATNLEKMLRYVDDAANQGANLVAFPELCLPGLHPKFNMMSIDFEATKYWVDSSEYVPEGDSVQVLIAKAKERDIYITWTMVERDKEYRYRYYNCAVLVGPEGFVGKYRKIHQPGTERLYLNPGNEIEVFDTKIGKIGMMICFDRVWPEAARCLKMKGAEIIVEMSAWPAEVRGDTTTHIADVFLKTGFMRAFENSVILIDCCAASPSGVNSILEGLEFGHSNIYGPDGISLSSTDWDEAMCIAELDTIGIMDETFAFQGISGMDFIRDLRPDIYIPIFESYKR